MDRPSQLMPTARYSATIASIISGCRKYKVPTFVYYKGYYSSLTPIKKEGGIDPSADFHLLQQLPPPDVLPPCCASASARMRSMNSALMS